MSAELYDAEMAGALARPAIDVLPSSHPRKDKSPEHVEAVQDTQQVTAPPATDPAATDLPAVESPTLDSFAAPAPPEALSETPAVAIATEHVPVGVAETPAPRKVFGMSLTRSRKHKSTEEEEVAAAGTDAVTTPENLAPARGPVAEESPASVALVDASSDDPPTAAPTEIMTLAPALPDHTEEVRAMRALLEASEQVRQAAEARTSAAESQLRTVTNTVQEWQIRHREAEATITELAASLTNSEVRMAELHQQVNAITAERDELVSQLDAATSPVTS